MDLRLALYQLADRHRLAPRATARLEVLARLGDPPDTLSRRLPIGLAVLAAALLGGGLILWIAANWATLGRFGRFAVLQTVLLAFGLAALWRPALRAPLALVVLLATGALLAYFGQTYQTGADPWQLFALWAALTLPLAWGARSDVLWTAWVLVAFVGLSLWIQAHTGHQWRVEPDDLAVHLLGWAAALVIVIAMGGPGRRVSGAGPWALRTAASLAVIVVTVTALGGLFAREIAAHYALGLLALALLAAAFATPRSFDVFALSGAALGLNTLLVAGLGRLLFEHSGNGDPIGRLFLLGVVAAGLLAASVSGVLRLSRARVSPGASS